jgi:hypothetical protein
MGQLTIERILDCIRRELHLSKEQETELLAEMRSHLEEAVADARERGESEATALERAAKDLGVEMIGAQLQQVHSGWESSSAIAATALPVLFALVLRWLAFAPDGSALGWPQLLNQPGFWFMAATSLVVPALLFRRWRLTLAGWGVFWLLTVIFTIFPSIHQW